MASSASKLDNLEIKEMQVIPCTNSPYIQSSRVTFKQVNILIRFNTTLTFIQRHIFISLHMVQKL